MENPECRISAINHRDTHAFSHLIEDYLALKPSIKDFYEYNPNWEGIHQAIMDRAQFPIDRHLLVSVLKKQYENRDTFHLVDQNIELLLQDNTYTICSAHQPNLLTGHLYFFYKIIHSIKLAHQLKERYPDKNFVPVFYIGSEDNDLDELNHFYFRGQTLTWPTQQTGAVGRMRGIDLDDLKKDLFALLGQHSDNHREIKRLIEECYNPQLTIAEGTARFLHELMADYGLVVINPDEAQLKSVIQPIILDELFSNTASKIVRETSDRLTKDYASQAFVRDINLFYLKENIRERIEWDGGVFKVVHTDITFTEDDIREELAQHPERFSPNVILRGVYQESILPNIAFIGGGSEVAYWGQLRDVFKYFNVFYPTVILRQSIQYIHKNTALLIAKNNLSWPEVFDNKEKVLQRFIEAHQEYLHLDEEWSQLESLVQSIQDKASKIDYNLIASSGVLKEQVKHAIERFKKKMFRAEKNKWTVKAQQLEDIHQHIFPHNTLQERQENFLEYYAEMGPYYFELIYKAVHPFGDAFALIIEE